MRHKRKSIMTKNILDEVGKRYFPVSYGDPNPAVYEDYYIEEGKYYTANSVRKLLNDVRSMEGGYEA